MTWVLWVKIFARLGKILEGIPKQEDKTVTDSSAGELIQINSHLKYIILK